MYVVYSCVAQITIINYLLTKKLSYVNIDPLTKLLKLGFYCRHGKCVGP